MAAQLGLTDMVEMLGKDLGGADRAVAISLASFGGHVDVFDFLLRSSDEADSLNLSEAMRYASARGYDQIVRRLLQHSERISHSALSSPDDLICQAAQLGYESQVRLFLEYHANVEACHDGMTPLQYAVQNGNTSVVHYLLDEARADVDSKSGDDRPPPIWLAVKGGYEVVVEHLLASHANIADQIDWPDRRTPLHLASQSGHQGIMELLVNHYRADENRQVSGGVGSSRPPSDDEESTKWSIINAKDPDGMTPLMLACAGGHEGVARLLMLLQPNTTLRDATDHTALYYATICGRESLAEMILSTETPIDSFKDIGDVFLRAAGHGLTNIINRCLEGGIAVNDVALKDYKDNNGHKAIHHAAKSGNEGIVSILLEDGARLDDTDDKERTPLVLAAEAGQADMVKVLLTRGADPLWRTSDDKTIVIKLAQRPECSTGHVEVIKILLDHGVNVNETDEDGSTALHWAAQVDNLKIVKTLLQHDVDVKLKNKHYFWNSLHYAARNVSESATTIAKLLIRAGVDPLDADVDGWTPMHMASMYGNIEIMELLWGMSSDSEVDSRAEDGRTAIHFAYDEPESLGWLLQHGFTSDVQDEDGRTALMVAARSGVKQSIRILLDKSASLKIRDKRSWTALHHAAYDGQTEVGKMLLNKDPSILCYRNDHNLSALHLAIRESNMNFAEFLLDNYYSAGQEDLNSVETDFGNTALMSAIKYVSGNTVVEKLLKLDVDTETRNKDGDTALLVAIQKDNDDHLSKLLDPKLAKPANVNAGGGIYRTALHAAAQDGNSELVQKLVDDWEADVNASGGTYNTALSAAAAEGCAEIVDFLLERKADPNMNGGIFSNALSAALYSGLFDLVPELISKGADVYAQDSLGRTALHIAAWQDSRAWETIKEIEGISVDHTVTDKQERTLLHHAAAGGNFWVIFELLEDNPLLNLDVEDADGWTPLHWACRRADNDDVVSILIEHGADVLKSTKDGWTPENVSIFEGVDDYVGLIGAKADERNELTRGDDAGEKSRTPSSELALEQSSADPGEGRHWKVGMIHEFISCDGCLHEVS